MENKVYYGEYTLKHWIKLILKKNIRLPEYQRSFVWGERQVLRLVDTFKNNEFVPSIIIGSYRENGVSKNLILDGQQRLTSIFLAYLNIMPNKEVWKKDSDSIATHKEGEEISEFGQNLDNILGWTFDCLVDIGETKNKIIESLDKEKYNSLKLDLDEKFFEDRYLGFSYIVPKNEDDVCDAENQQKFYSSVFRNINIQGMRLLPQESRTALYYFNPKMKGFFLPDFCKRITLKSTTSSHGIPFDFVRYMSLLSQYKKESNSVKNLAYGYRSHMEEYYESYIFSVLGEVPEELFYKFDTIFSGDNYKTRLDELKKAIVLLNLQSETFTSISIMDVNFFGLVYYTMFEGYNLRDSEIENLKEKLKEKINEYKNNDLHTRSPNSLKYMRSRVEDSIGIYKDYVSSK